MAASNDGKADVLAEVARGPTSSVDDLFSMLVSSLILNDEFDA
jgi:hypothetical protein